MVNANRQKAKTMKIMDSKGKVLLIYPGPKTKLPRLPMSCIVLAAHLRQKNFQVDILDTRLDSLDNQDFSDYLCVGISSMSGVQLKHAVNAATSIKANYPNLPLVWGGAHVSFYPEISAADDLVDYVVRGEGEESFIEVIERVIINKEFQAIDGAIFYREGKCYSGGNREFIDPDTLAFPAYDLVDLAKYADYIEGFSYETSRGCPYRCRFCYNLLFHDRKWRKKSSEKVITELKRIKNDLGARKLYFIDDNFMVSLPRVKEICAGIKNEGINWAAAARANYLAKYDRSDFAVLKESGCLYLQCGAESGSVTELEHIHKDITPREIIDTAKNCIDGGIMPVFSFMIGMPNETEQDRLATLDIYDQIMKVSSKIEINGIFVYTPYPGTSLYAEALALGYQQNKTFQDWINWSFSDAKVIPWLNRKLRASLQAIETLSTYKFYIHRMNFYSKEFRRKKLGKLGCFLYGLVIPVMNLSANFRWKHRFFDFAWEWRFWKFIIARFFPR
ncbi:MAG: B12-binding domain-containing radical SAM protein [Candidatus Omnitrophica bacterium]|nr:B12-binding domain-containing radical SAM protein [Candidatus Omnitrophota bacterium]